MKKLLACICLIVATVFGVAARDTYSRDMASLPEAARNVVSKNFKSEVNLIKIDKDFGRISEYDVILTDGSEISFDSKGNWKDVEVPQGMAVPTSFVPAAVAKYLSDNYRNSKVVSIERDHRGYDVELDNGIDLKFDKAGNFKKFD